MKYYQLRDKNIVAVSSRGVFVFADNEWYPAFDIITEREINAGEEISEADLNELIREQRRKKEKARKAVFVDRISTGATEIKDGGSLYLSSIPVIKALLDGQMINIESPVTFFVGDNGTGKSTLLEAIAIAIGYNAEGGGKNFDFETRNTHRSA